MKSSLKKNGDCKMRLTVEVEAERVEARYLEVLKDFRKNAQLPGFRQGRVPADLIEKKYSKEAQEETLKSLIPEAYHQSLTSHRAFPVSLPAISDIKFQRGKSLQFAAEFENVPEFSLKNYKGIRLKKVSSEVFPEEVEKGIASLLESRAELSPPLEPRAVRPGDFLLTDIEIRQEERYIPARKGALLYVEPHLEDDFCEKVTGALVDEVREISVDPSEKEKERGVTARKPLYKVCIRGIR